MKKKNLFSMIFFLFCAGMYCNNQWVLAASPFSANNLPEHQKSTGYLFPKLLMERFQGISTHGYLPEELEYLKNSDFNKKKQNLVSQLQNLLEQRDKLDFNFETSLEINKKKGDIDYNISEKRKELEKLIEENEETEYPSQADIVFWSKSSTEGSNFPLLTFTGPVSTALKSNSLSAILTGDIEPIDDFILITVNLYIYGVNEPYTFEVIGSWDNLDTIADEMSKEIIPLLLGQSPAVISLETNPPDAQVYLDGQLLPKNRFYHFISAGKYTISAESENHYTSTIEADFESGKEYLISCILDPLENREISFNTVVKKDKKPARIYIEGEYKGLSENIFTVPDFTVLGFAKTEDNFFSWFLVEPGKENFYDLSLKEKNLEEEIESRRNKLYWSLGAFYLYLPIPIFVYSQYNNLYNAYAAGYLSADMNNYNKIVSWQRASIGTIGGAVVLGANLGYQIARYIITSNKVAPSRLK